MSFWKRMFEFVALKMDRLKMTRTIGKGDDPEG
jgi:hypothetical protein